VHRVPGGRLGVGRGVVSLVLVAAVVAGACSSGSNDSGKSAGTTTTGAPRQWVARLVSEQPVDLAVRQGIASRDDGYVLNGTNQLFGWPRGTNPMQPNPVVTSAIPPAWAARGFNHVGDIDIARGVLYAPYEQPHYARGVQAVALYDAHTFAFRRAFTVKQNENSFVSVDAATHTAYSMMHFGGHELLRYRIGPDGTWRRITPLRMSRYVDKVQGADVADGAIWLASDDAAKGLYRVDLATGATTRVGSMGHHNGKSEAEGIDAGNGVLRTVMVVTIAGPVLVQTFRVEPR
jgi:hypothetical protein